MLAKPPSCAGCPLERAGAGFIRPQGAGTSGVAIVGEAGGKQEALKGYPFVEYAQSGSLLEQCFRVLKQPRNNFKLTNIVSCHPPNDILEGAKYAESAINHCKQYLNGCLDSFQPKCTLAVGGLSLRELTGFSGITNFRGYAFNTRFGYVVGALHPAYIRRGKSQLLPTLVYDLQKALRIAYGQFTKFLGHPDYRLPNYCEHPTVDDAWGFYHRCAAGLNQLLVYDIENPESAEAEEDEREKLEFNELVQIQFSLGKDEGIAFPWTEPYIGIAKKILALENPKAGHNVWLYDNPVMKALYNIVPNGVVHDTLAMFHHAYPDLEAGLQKASSLFDFPFPWKHLAGENLAFYGCADVDSPHYIMERLPDEMKARGIWGSYEDKKGYLGQVFSFYPILVKMQNRGVGVNIEYREQFKQTVTEKLGEVDKDLQAGVPIEVCRPEPAKGYKTVPPDVRAAIERYNYHKALFEGQGKTMVTLLSDYIFKQTGMVEREFEVKYDELGRIEKEAKGFVGAPPEQCSMAGSGNAVGGDSRPDGRIKVTRWARVAPFSARSSQQVVKYIRWASKHAPTKKLAKLHKVPQTLKDQKDTTSKEEMERLYFATQDLVYRWIVEYREYAKILSTDLPMWEPGPDSRVHTTFTFGPASQQLATRNPNIQNVIKHTKSEAFRFKREIELGKAFRRMIVPSPGRKIMEFDKSAFHVVMLGREAQSVNYIRIAKADMHSFFASHLLARGGKPVRAIDPSDDINEIKEQCKWIKKNYKGVRDTKAKPTVLGVGLGLGGHKLWFMNRENISNQGEAKGLLAMFFELFPEIKAFQNAVRLEAYNKHCLMSAFGATRSFYDVYQKRKDPATGKWKLVPGADSEKAIAFKVQANAFGMMRQEMMRLERINANARFKLINTVHDSLVYEPNESDIELCYRTVTKVMNSPCKALADSVVCPDGLVVEVDCQIGDNWADLGGFRL